ncbi:MAG: hypothetical protein QW115_00975 [Thermoplasmata archaeon]
MAVIDKWLTGEEEELNARARVVLEHEVLSEETKRRVEEYYKPKLVALRDEKVLSKKWLSEMIEKCEKGALDELVKTTRLKMEKQRLYASDRAKNDELGSLLLELFNEVRNPQESRKLFRELLD